MKQKLYIKYHSTIDGTLYEILDNVPNYKQLSENSYFISKETIRTIKLMKISAIYYVKMLIFGRSLNRIEKSFEIIFEEQK